MTDFLLGILQQSPIYQFLYGYIAFNVIWIIRLTLAFIGLAKLRDKVGETSWLFRVPAVIFFIGDIIFNWEMSLLFWDLPKKWDETITNRLARFKKLKPDTILNQYRIAVAVFFCRILSKYDPGHC